MLNNAGENILNVNLKEDEDTGEFYGFKNIYRAIFNLFPIDFVQYIEEASHLNRLDRLLGYITYRDFFL